MPAPEIIAATRLVASPAALDALSSPPGVPVLRLAPDEALVIGPVGGQIDDGFALEEADDGFGGLWMDRAELAVWLAREAEWQAPPSGFVQGMAAGLAVKVWVDEDRALVLCRTSLLHELENRL